MQNPLLLVTEPRRRDNMVKYYNQKVKRTCNGLFYLGKNIEAGHGSRAV
jgi:hypothetical protein